MPFQRNHKPRSASPTSWQGVSSWYNDSVGESGHYYHQHVVLPGVLKLLGLREGDSLLDIACGQGVLARAIAFPVRYLGFDAAGDLIASARRQKNRPEQQFEIADATKPFPVKGQTFSHAACLLALQNIEHPEKVFRNAAAVLEDGSTFVVVLNHPAFRIPRQSSWEVDEKNKLQYRRVNRYLSPLKIPIAAHPGQPNTAVTWSFHQPLGAYIQMASAAGFVVDALEEWTSDKQSQGKAAKMENRGRSEFPLFCALRFRKFSPSRATNI